jgi:CRISPR system Cascade subunit CasB
MSIGNQLFTGWPEQILGTPNESSKALIAVKTALQLYAYHQQSETTPMDVIIDGDTEDERHQQRLRGAFGRACRGINPDLDTSAGVRRRLGSIESASDFDGVKRNIRALILLLKSSRQTNPQDYQIDYRALSEDLYRLQFDSVRDSVFLRWGEEYFTASPESKNNAASTTEK